MKKFSLIKSLMLVCLWCIGMGAWGEDADYTLDPSAGSNNSYTGNCDVTVDGITWNVTGNAQMTPWRLGGKSITKVDRVVYSKTAYTSAVSKIDLTVGAASSITVNSLKLVYSTNSDFSSPSEISKSFTANSTISFEGDFPANAYYKFIFNVTVSGSNNKFVEFRKVEFFNKTTSGGGSTVTAPTFDVAAGTYTEDKLVHVNNYDGNYLYAYTTDGSAPAFDAELNVANGTAYDNNKGIAITSSCTLKVIAVDENGNKSSVTSAAYVINKPQVFASLAELVAADLTSGTNVTVSFENVPIKAFQTVSSTRKGVYFDIQKGGNDIEIYFNSAIPNEWAEGGTLSGTLTNCPWKLYSSTWELAPASASGWEWSNLTYHAPVQKTITALTVSGTPTKTTYNVGDAFETAGLVVIATYSDETQAPIATGFNWEIDYGTGNKALVEGATSVDVMVSTDNDVMSEVYTVNGLTVNVPVTLTSIAVSGTPTKTSYYAGDAFETAGLVVTGTYSDSHQEVITEGIEWKIDPEVLALGTTSVDVIAGVGAVVSEVYKVNELSVTENPYKTASKKGFTAVSGYVNSDIRYESSKGNAGTAPAINSNNIRLYQNGGYITISGLPGVTIAEVAIRTGSTYATTTIGVAVDDDDAPATGTTVAKNTEFKQTGLSCQSISFYCLGTDKDSRLDIDSIGVKYTKEDVVLASIAVSGTYKTKYIQNQAFDKTGAVVTATYSVGAQEDVTASAVFSEPDMTTTGVKTITISYKEGDITKETSYNITVAAEEVTELTLSGDYKTVFHQSEDFDHTGLVVKANYNSDRADIDVTSSVVVSTPDFSTLGQKDVTVSFGGQSTAYTIKVIDDATIFYESFDKNDGKGANDGFWSGTIASSSLVYDNNGWGGVKQNGAAQCAKFGTGSVKGSATTPEIDATGNFVLTFKAAAWDNKDENTTLNISATDADLDKSSVTLAKGQWTEYNVIVKNATNGFRVKFDGYDTNNSRFFLDEVSICTATTATIAVNATAQYGTFCAPFAVEVPEGVTASTATLDGETIVLASVGETIPANTPVVLYAEKGLAATNVYGREVAGTPEAGVLTGVYEETPAPNGSYVLQLQSGKVGFYQVDTEVVTPSVGANRAYLTVPSSSASARAFFFDAETAISTIEALTSGKAEIYNLNGVKLNGLQKGINIVNGKKVLVK